MSFTPKLCRYSLFLVVIFAFCNRVPLAAMAFANCSDVCGSSAECDTFCLDDYDDGNTCGGYEGGQGAGYCWGDSCNDVCGLARIIHQGA